MPRIKIKGTTFCKDCEYIFYDCGTRCTHPETKLIDYVMNHNLYKDCYAIRAVTGNICKYYKRKEE